MKIGHSVLPKGKGKWPKNPKNQNNPNFTEDQNGLRKFSIKTGRNSGYQKYSKNLTKGPDPYIRKKKDLI